MKDYIEKCISEENEPILYTMSPGSFSTNNISIKKGHLISKERHAFDLEHKDLGRNSLCSCGSEKKFKNCCLKHRPT